MTGDVPALMHSASRWRSGAIVCTVASVWALLAALGHGAAVCKGGLDERTAPSGWESFAPLPDHGGFAISSRYVGKMGYGHEADGILYDPALCRYSGVSLDGWLSGSFAGNYRGSNALKVAKDPSSDVYVVSGIGESWSGNPPAFHHEPMLVAAFRRSATTRIGWVGARWPILSAMFLAGVIVCAYALIASARKLARARSLLDPSIEPPEIAETDYRTAGSRGEIEVPVVLVGELATSALGLLRVAVGVTIFVAIAAALGVGCAELTEAAGNIY